ncbi:thioesterase [Nisaea acidiphila]|uniref:Thioesterase n=1 Tax=Nisaea acidiphila TaxID=1862145 RepID=A0A9J7B0T1_9PROT|nr:thioesterase family protein [Nisaea acidiphila]UUX51293.1 thioesterase [Nisaea acidiphila]
MSSDFEETFRGDVKAWECDVVEHFTVAYYYEKFEAAAWRFLRESGVDPREARTTDCYTRYHAELRKGDLFHIESALIQTGLRPVIAHKLYNSDTGTVCTTMEQTLDGASLPGSAAHWDGPVREERAPVKDSATWVRAGTDVVRPSDLDWTGKLGLGGLIHQFSGSGFHALASIGLSPTFLRENRRGFSTFEFQIEMDHWPEGGDLVHVESTVAHVGSSSIRLVHRLIDTTRGKRLAELGQFGVLLDLDTRKPTRLPEPVLEKVRALVGG